MKRTLLAAIALLSLATAVLASADDDLAKAFRNPPDSAKPWVYWFWSDGNISRDGITADLEAMHRVGIRGVLIMDVDQGIPKGPAPFLSPKWRELFQHVLKEATRLNIEVDMNNDGGWCGSGGPWITPELSMQIVVWSETHVTG
ncbi:MAG TPA: glycosyl hydrolase, partial [Bryobacteraceae bacterium]|nr:glycosyl hydrolase [Bryobacteraceae bacterium]